jgi:2-methylcitrate dehydratase PrpD
MTTSELSSRFADFVLDLDYARLDANVIRHTKKALIDLLGVSFAGYKLVPLSKLVVDHAISIGGAEQATILQTDGKYPAETAAFVNGALAHALDMDDGHRYAGLHPGAVVIPAALAAAEFCGADSKEMIEGIVGGYEVAIRIGRSINPSSLGRGFHSTGTVGPFGAAVAAAKIMKLNREQIIGAIGLAGLQGAGLLQVNHDEGTGGQAKLMNSARAAMSGMYSAILAAQGAAGPRLILEGKDGFLGAYADKVQSNLLLEGLGSKFEICETYIKFYASGRHSHACIDAALEAFEQSGLKFSQIERIEVETYQTAIRFTGIQPATTPSSARFSIAFSIALALVKGNVSADQFTDENIADDALQSLAAKVHVSASEKWESAYPKQRGATVRIFGADGSVSVVEIPLAKGEPETPATAEELRKKFMTNACVQISRENADAVYRVVMNLENESMAELMNLLRSREATIA